MTISCLYSNLRIPKSLIIVCSFLLTIVGSEVHSQQPIKLSPHNWSGETVSCDILHDAASGSSAGTYTLSLGYEGELVDVAVVNLAPDFTKSDITVDSNTKTIVLTVVCFGNLPPSCPSKIGELTFTFDKIGIIDHIDP